MFNILKLMSSATSLSRAALLAAAVAITPIASAQLKPDRLYYGINRSVPMTVSAPTRGGELSIKLLAPVTAEVVASAPVAAGGVDLAGLFPKLWQPEGDPRVMYAQLFAGETRVGPAVVIQPMAAGRQAAPILDPGTQRTWMWSDPRVKVYSGVRAYTDQRVILETTAGDAEFMLRPDEAPNTAFNFLHLARGGYYTDIPFHRIATFLGRPSASVLQAGDPTTTNEGGPGYMIDLEDSRVPHEFGVLSMARDRFQPNTAGAQVFIVLDREPCIGLDGQYTTFAQAVRGADVLVKLGATPVEPGTDKPVDAPRITRARVVDAPPYEGVPAFLSPPVSEAPPQR